MMKALQLRSQGHLHSSPGSATGNVGWVTLGKQLVLSAALYESLSIIRPTSQSC